MTRCRWSSPEVGSSGAAAITFVSCEYLHPTCELPAGVAASTLKQGPGPVSGRDTMTGSHHRILVVEDDPETAGQLADSLASNGYQVDVAASGGEALSRGIAGGYAVITIDRMLPDIDGIAVMRRLRDGGVAAPILIISALGEVDDRVRGLRAGGDDYLVKPFSFVELLARVEALGRRSDTVVKETVLRVGDLAMDLVSRTASRGGKDIWLLPREFQLLEYLVRNEGRIVSRAMLLQHVWDLHFDPTTNIIEVYVGRVRRKVDGQQAYPLIHTVRGIGYCLRAPR
jgi:two-component system OmpR family response regulator